MATDAVTYHLDLVHTSPHDDPMRFQDGPLRCWIRNADWVELGRPDQIVVTVAADEGP